LLLRAGLSRGVPIFAIDPTAPRPPAVGVQLVSAPAERFLPDLVRRLGCSSPAA
jgi:hypothetical protein